MGGRLVAGVISLLLLAAAPVRAATCIEAVLAKVECSNPDEVCRTILGPGRSPKESLDFESIFDFRVQELGDGTKGYVFAHRAGSDAYALVPNFHFAEKGGALVLSFDGKGLPSTYLTDRPRVNGRWQIERVRRADIPDLYRKREAERWFWTGSEYARAFSRVTVEQAKNPKENGVTTTWDPAAEAAYRTSGGSGGSWTHTVVAGDTLGAIAKKHGVSVDEIMRQNDLRSAASLRLGQQIRYEGWKVSAR
jgi:hypothetical protein